MTPIVQAPPPDSLRAVLHRVFASPEYAWQVPGDGAWSLLGRAWRGLVEWLLQLRETHPVAHMVLLVAMSALLLAILVHFGYLIWRALRPPAAAKRGIPGESGVIRDAAWHLAEAEQCAAEGRYAEALGHRFLALVLDLDRREVLAFHPSKTPAEYARELRLTPAATSAFAALVTVLYRYLYAGQPCGPEEMRWFDREALELGRQIAAR